MTSMTCPPTVTTEAPDSVLDMAANLRALVITNGAFGGTVWFRYDTSNPGTCNDTFGTRAPATGGLALPSSDYPGGRYGMLVLNLAPGVTYYYCALASTSGGSAVGSVVSFTTQTQP
jgi:hypothetical protein